MPDKSLMEKAYEDALAGKDAAKAEAQAKENAVKKQNAANIAKKKAAPLDPKFGMPAAKKPSPAKGMPY